MSRALNDEETETSADKSSLEISIAADNGLLPRLSVCVGQSHMLPCGMWGRWLMDSSPSYQISPAKHFKKGIIYRV